MKFKRLILLSAGLTLLSGGGSRSLQAAEGIRERSIRVGSVLALVGPARGLGMGMKSGLRKALEGKRVRGRTYRLIFKNDSYEPDQAMAATRRLLKKDVFAFLGNVGTPTAAVTLPLLAPQGIPAVGFFTGAGLLRPGPGNAVNFRASYLQETEKVIHAAISAGLEPDGVCAYVQNDSYGMAGLRGITAALKKAGANPQTLKQLEEIIAMEGDGPDRNNRGPVGVYTRNSIRWKQGFGSLLRWEKQSGKRCRLVVTVGAYSNIALFIRGSRKQERNWVVSAVSFTGAELLRKRLKKYRTTDRVLMTQVVPLPDSNLPIVREAKARLGSAFGIVSLEGYIVGAMFHRIMSDIKGPLSRRSFMEQVKRSRFDLGGVAIDFTRNGYQASDLVIPGRLTKRGWKEMDAAAWSGLFRQD